MKARRDVSLASIFLILSILACTMPGAGGDTNTGGDTQPAQPDPKRPHLERALHVRNRKPEFSARFSAGGQDWNFQNRSKLVLYS